MHWNIVLEIGYMDLMLFPLGKYYFEKLSDLERKNILFYGNEHYSPTFVRKF
jgi:hypothetical protein